MEPFNSIEAKLQRLVPPSLSEDGELRLEEAVDRLAGVQSRGESQGRPAAGNAAWLWKAVAVVAVLVIPVVMIQFADRDAEDSSLAQVDPSISLNVASEMANLQEMVLLKSTKLIDGRVDDGLIVPDDGATPHYRYRYRVVDEEQVRDLESGSVITIRQPRQEVVTIPVTQF